MESITFNGNRIWSRTRKGRFSSFKATISKLWFYSKIGAAILLLLFGVRAFTQWDDARTMAVEKIYLAPQAPKESMAAVLAKIADCESGNGKPGTAQHYTKGQVTMRANEAGTSIDIGRFQINLMHWGKKATELGYDLTKEKDNEAMARWIYENRGTGDWSSSQKCWQR